MFVFTERKVMLHIAGSEGQLFKQIQDIFTCVLQYYKQPVSEWIMKGGHSSWELTIWGFEAR